MDKDEFKCKVFDKFCDIDQDCTAKYFIDSLKEIVLEVVPRKISKRNKYRNSPWFNQEILSLKKLRRKLHRKWRKSKSPFDFENFRAQCTLVRKKIVEAKRDFFANAFSNINQSEVFNKVNMLLKNRSNQLPDCENKDTLCNEFNRFLSTRY